VRLLMDTVALVYAIESPHRLSRRAKRVFAGGDYVREVSALSLSEIAIKTHRGQLEISDSQVNQALKDLDVDVLAYTRAHALRLFGLPWHHTDPFDRQILAQALEENIPIVTSDEVFGRYDGIRVIW
jgi:PIN domain nuclease of toxin-antitoxin system